MVKKMLEKIKTFWLSSYLSDKVAFYYELVSFVLIIGASITLAITATSPDMRYIYPGYFLGSITALYAHYRRRLAWPTLLVGYFCMINIYGWLIAMEII